MAAPILPAHLSIPHITLAPAAPQSTASGGAFQSAFADAVSKVESFQQNAQSSVNRFLSGEGEELHKVAISTQQAELSFQLFMQVRNKIVAAYNQVMQMQV
ncbi:MAG TPA: flagellar hook-basal body complex protein FliE [Bryobacteraceae bacterium]|nr:flagellar hook-basal body complex protein FliE [Bryobacteraceae bacterium]